MLSARLPAPGRRDDLDTVLGQLPVSARQARFVQLYNGGRYFRVGAPGQKEEIVPPVCQNRHLAAVDGVGIGHDQRCLRLPEYLLQPHGRKTAAVYQVVQHTPRADTGQLIRIADQDQSRSRLDCPQECRHQHTVHHGCLVNDDDLLLQQILLVAAEATTPAILVKAHLQQTVNGLRLAGSGLGQALCRSAGGRSQRNLHPHGIEYLDQRVYDRCLSRSGTSGQDHNPVAKRVKNRLFLPRGIGHPDLLLLPPDE